MTIQDTIDKIRLYVGDTKKTRFSDSIVVSEMNNSLAILSEATKAKVERSHLILVQANKTTYSLPEDIIATTRFEQLAPRKVESYGIYSSDTKSIALTDNIPVVTEADLASRNFVRVDDIEIASTYGFRRDTSKSTISAIVKDSLEEHKLEIYPRLTEPSFELTQEELDLLTANGDLDAQQLALLTVGTNNFVPVLVYSISYFDIQVDVNTLNSNLNLGLALTRILEHLVSANLLAYDTNSASINSSNMQMKKYKAELNHYKKRISCGFHEDKDRRYFVKKRRIFTPKFTSDSVGGFSSNNDFGTILPIQ